MNASQIRLCNALWTAGNNAGVGYAPYTDVPGDDTVENAVAAFVADGWVVLSARTTSDSIAILGRDDDTVGVGDAHGAWAVDLGSLHGIRESAAPEGE